MTKFTKKEFEDGAARRKVEARANNITIWEIWNADDQCWQHNHIENGHSNNDKPEPKFVEQNSWRGQTWRKTFGRLVDGKVTR